MASQGPSTSLGAVSGARAAYDIHSSNNQENQTSRKPASTNNSNLRQRSTSNLRQPLSNVQSGRRTDQGRSAANGARNAMEKSSKQDLYKKKSSDKLKQAEQYDDIPENMYRPDKEDAQGWIHREKLAKIENEELQAAGINLAKGRSRNREASGSRSRDMTRETRDLGSGSREEKRMKMSSPVSEDAPADPPEQEEWDPRTPEEIADDAAAGQIYSSPSLRKSGSRIPVMASSPTPIPSDRYERDTPMPRKRTLSGSITPDESLSIIRSRTRQDGEPGTPGGKPESPSKTRSRSTSNPRATEGTPGAKKTPNQTKTPMPPNSYNNNRPPTRSSETDRPRTATNPPEGDPPWLLTMYKPDPMLPPDQQLIPTLAKKQQQELWEANGKIPSTYDRNFSPLVIYGADGKPQRQPSGVPGEHKQEPQQPGQPEQSIQSEPTPWPLKPATSPTKVTITGRPPTSSGTGGYSTMPKVTAMPPTLAPSPKIESRSPASSRAHTPQLGRAASPHVSQVTQSAAGAPSRLKQQSLSDAQDEKIQKKGCCCIVM